MPFPSNDERQFAPASKGSEERPWNILRGSDISPMCFEVQFANGELETFAYSDFRGAKLLHNGYAVLRVLGMEKMHIVIEGRHLKELVKHISLGKILSIQESPNHGYQRSEEQPHIEKITVDVLTGPGGDF
ncbi:MAG: hypothetical protein Aurels2KO_53860 [Aureliella sp.]